MANTYTQLYIHFVFAVQNRASLICESWEAGLYKYITGIAEQQEHKLMAINGMPDHLHVLVSMNPKQSPSDLMFHMKRSSSLWINENKLVQGKFSWQEGFGAFSYGKSQIPVIAGYIEKQKQHHARKTFIREYTDFLKAFGIDYDERYTFKAVE
ncbi:MAG TPA: IS200/IS605 family transposase [Bacteroidales bacterium]|nr:IS200/IS605 family transposase [Bacteroidales bacterium]